MSPRAWIVGLAALACGGCASATAAHVRYPIAPTTASNRAAAIADAAKLLSYVVPPSGAVLQSSGSGTGPKAQLLIEALASAVAYRHWLVPESMSDVLTFVHSHLPAGSKVVGTGSGSGPGSQTSQEVTYQWPPVPGVLYTRWLEVSVAAPVDGQTSLDARSQSQWIVTRRPSESVPAGVASILVTQGWLGKRPRISVTVDRPPQIRMLVSLLDSFPVVQPGAINCPALFASQTIAVSFRSARGSELARASASSQSNVSYGPYVAGWACFPTDFSVRGHIQTPLAGNVIRPLERILHVHFKPARP
jgi:hypothetical protein